MSMNLNLQYETLKRERISSFNLLQTSSSATWKIIGADCWEKFGNTPTLSGYLNWVKEVHDYDFYFDHKQQLNDWVKRQPGIFKEEGQFCWFVS